MHGTQDPSDDRDDHSRIRVLAADDLRQVGEIVPDVDWHGQFVVDDEGTLLVRNEDELIGYHIESGERRWSTRWPDIDWEHGPRTARVVAAGNRVVMVADTSVHVMPEGDPTGDAVSGDFEERGMELVSVLVSGGVFFLCYPGVIVSGELPR